MRDTRIGEVEIHPLADTAPSDLPIPSQTI